MIHHVSIPAREPRHVAESWPNCLTGDGAGIRGLSKKTRSYR